MKDYQDIVYFIIKSETSQVTQTIFNIPATNRDGFPLVLRPFGDFAGDFLGDFERVSPEILNNIVKSTNVFIQ